MTGGECVQVEGIHYKTNEPIRLTITNGAIERIDQIDGSENLDRSLPILAPGLVDLQVNGSFGLDFNTHPMADGVTERLTEALLRIGVTTYYPTAITNGDAEIEQSVSAIARACENDPFVAASIGGIHVEGPFISPHDGARGAHNRTFVKAPDWDLFERWQYAADGRIRLMTLSPEWPEAPQFIARCVERGIIVSIGHTCADASQIQAAVDAGASMSTHLGNGAHPMLPRHPNYIWDQLACDELDACFIADGFHLPDAFLKVGFRVKGERAMLVSDAVYLAGMPSGEYETHIGGQVVLTPEGKLHLAGNPSILAGSAQLLPWGIRHLVNRNIAAFDTAWEMASIRPARKMRLPAGAGLAQGAPADFVCLKREQDDFTVVHTYKNGQRIDPA